MDSSSNNGAASPSSPTGTGTNGSKRNSKRKSQIMQSIYGLFGLSNNSVDDPTQTPSSLASSATSPQSASSPKLQPASAPKELPNIFTSLNDDNAPAITPKLIALKRKSFGSQSNISLNPPSPAQEQPNQSTIVEEVNPSDVKPERFLRPSHFDQDYLPLFKIATPDDTPLQHDKITYSNPLLHSTIEASENTSELQKQLHFEQDIYNALLNEHAQRIKTTWLVTNW